MLPDAHDAIALIEAKSGQQITYSELHVRIERAADAIHTKAAGGISFVFCANDIATVVDYLGALRAGVPVALLDGHADPKVVVERYQPELIRGRALPPANGGGTPHRELALLLSTSGSTGSPKLVRLARTAIEANARAIAFALNIRPGEVAPTSLPIHYSYGLSVINSHLVAGATVLLTDDSLITNAFWQACREYGATSLAGVPYSYQMLRRLDLGRLLSLKTLTQAGGRLEARLVRHFHDLIAARGGRMFVMYGQTEATARMTILAAHELPARAGSVGTAVPGGSIQIKGADGAVSPNAVGEIVYRGPNVMMGYAERREDLARGDELGGELATGDLGYLDDDGCLWITGRSGRMAKLFGLRLNLDELEALLHEPGVPALAAIGDPDRVRVFVETTDQTVADRLRDRLVEHTGIHHSGFVVTPVASLPRLASGKVDYRRLEHA